MGELGKVSVEKTGNVFINENRRNWILLLPNGRHVRSLTSTLTVWSMVTLLNLTNLPECMQVSISCVGKWIIVEFTLGMITNILDSLDVNRERWLAILLVLYLGFNNASAAVGRQCVEWWNWIRFYILPATIWLRHELVNRGWNGRRIYMADERWKDIK